MNQNIALHQLQQLKSLEGGMRLAAEAWKSPFQTLISIILSARTLDETTIRVCEHLFSRYPTAQAMATASLKEIQEKIRPVNFYINKSKSILNCAKALQEEYNGGPPKDFEKLIHLPGVGPKTANVFLAEYGEDAIGVDTHVSYISQYLGWTDQSNPLKIEEDLKQLFPKNKWKEVNGTCVRFGKKYTSRKEKNKLLDEIKEH